jgi:hypothetical protein
VVLGPQVEAVIHLPSLSTEDAELVIGMLTYHLPKIQELAKKPGKHLAPIKFSVLFNPEHWTFLVSWYDPEKNLIERIELYPF